jgi:FixJ family two-component response regulator
MQRKRLRQRASGTTVEMIRNKERTLDQPHEPTDEMTTKGAIFVVEDDPAVREMLSIVLKAAGYDVVCFWNGAALFAAVRERCPVCILLDVYMPGESGLEILDTLQTNKCAAPIFVMSGQGTIAMAVASLHSGAVDFMEKPFHGTELVGRIECAIERNSKAKAMDPRQALSLNCHGTAPLSRREGEVLSELLLGRSSKEMGRHLGLSHRTIESHRANIMKKVGAKNALDLMRIALPLAGR